MTKVQKISKNITPFAGVFFAHDECKRSGLSKLIDNQLGICVSSICERVFRHSYSLRSIAAARQTLFRRPKAFLKHF